MYNAFLLQKLPPNWGEAGETAAGVPNKLQLQLLLDIQKMSRTQVYSIAELHDGQGMFEEVQLEAYLKLHIEICMNF